MSAVKEAPAYSPGLEGVIAGVSQISEIVSERSSLVFRGINVHELAEKATFEETAHLLLHYKLPNEYELHFFKERIRSYRAVPAKVLEALTLVSKDTHPMDQIKVAFAVAAGYDPDYHKNDHLSNLSKAERIMAMAPTIVTAGYRLKQGLEVIEPDPQLGHAANLLYMLTGNKPDAYTERVMDSSLTLYAEHSFNASTFACRVTVSTLSDVYSGILSGIGTLKGPLHGGANEQAMRMMLSIGDPAKAEAWIRDALAQKKTVMGFGHREYKKADSRALYLNKVVRELAEHTGDSKWVKIADILERVMLEQKGLYPNVDFPTAFAYYMLGIPLELYTPMFVVARVVGWCTHAIEQLDNNRLIRPTCIYNGRQNVEFTPVGDRV